MLRQSAKAVLRAAGFNRERVAASRMVIERTALASLPRKSANRQTGRILAYHSVGQPRTGVNDVSIERFERQLDLAAELGFEFVPASQIAATHGTAKQLAITVDDAWTSVAENIAPILRKRKIPWTLFVVSGWSSQTDEWTQKDILHWNDLKELMDDDLEIGSHSVNHPDFAKLTVEQTQFELEASRAAITENLGIDPTSFAIPFGQSSNWHATAQELAKKAGYDTIYSQAERTAFPGTVRRTFVTKFDNDRIFKALLNGAFDNWEEWV